MLIPAGTVIGGGYVIGKAIGGGGMAVVYEGEELHNGRPVAVKVLPLHLVQSEESTKRFLKEARISASLSHPNICRILHFGTLEDGRPYYVMELLQGESLSERISREGALPMLEGVEIVMQLLAGLREAHRNGIVHRDVKPGNVFLHDRADGRQMVKLLDFGVSKDVVAQRQESEDTTQLTQTGMIWGTPFYFAPEQALGSRLLDSRVDLWGAGVVLYEVLTGRKPFMAPTYPGLLAKITAEPAVPVTKLRPAAAPEFDRLLDKALAKNPLERYANAAEFLRDLQAVRVGLLGGAEAR
jgi:serine/threonine-protein kinase